jgi:hypothetical protein
VKSKKAKWLNSLPEFAGLTLSFRFRQVFVRSSSIESIMTLKSSTKCSILAKKDFEVPQIIDEMFNLGKEGLKGSQIIDEMFNLG